MELPTYNLFVYLLQIHGVATMMISKTNERTSISQISSSTNAAMEEEIDHAIS